MFRLKSLSTNTDSSVLTSYTDITGHHEHPD